MRKCPKPGDARREVLEKAFLPLRDGLCLPGCGLQCVGGAGE